MNRKKEVTQSQQVENDLSKAEADTHGPSKLTFAENAILTVKVLAGFGLLGAAIWGIELWTTAR